MQPDLYQRVATFIEDEVALLDAGDLHAWVDLCTDDATYWMPVSRDQTDPLGEISILYESRTLMDLRKYNFGHALAPSFESPVVCSHILGRIRVTSATADEITAQTKFHCLMWYRDEQRLFAGDVTYRLVPHEESFQIRSKRVDLVNASAAHKSIPIYL